MPVSLGKSQKNARISLLPLTNVLICKTGSSHLRKSLLISGIFSKMFSSMQNPKILVCKQTHWMGNLVVNIIIYNVQRCQKRLLFDDKIKKDVPTKI